MDQVKERILQSPFLQAAIIFSVAFLIASIEKIVNVLGWAESDPNSPWIVFTTFILFFSIATSITSLKADSMNKYWGQSMLAFALFVVASGFSAYMYSGLGIDEAGSFRWLFVVLTFGFLVFLSIVRLMKRIVDIAIKQDDRLRGE